jgi:hypothetical protein
LKIIEVERVLVLFAEPKTETRLWAEVGEIGSDLNKQQRSKMSEKGRKKSRERGSQ